MKRTILLGMSGFGNSALNAILGSKEFVPVAVFIPTKDAFYTGESLQRMADDNLVPVYQGFNFGHFVVWNFIKSLQPDLIIISTFRQIIPQEVIDIPTIGVINIHPSLLPKYRGPTPIDWAFYKGEKETGVTVHWVDDEKPDSGRIIIQKKLSINSNDRDSKHLREQLIELSESALEEALHSILIKKKEDFLCQDEGQATCFPRFPDYFGNLEAIIFNEEEYRGNV